jgi:hypothetical protein
MSKKLPIRDPMAAYQRKVTAERRIGEEKQCLCGEKRPLALVRKRNSTRCAKCVRQMKGKTTMDKHHPAGEANSPAIVPIPVNDHRAELSEAQYDWPKDTRENPDGSPLLAAAGCIRGFADTVVYLIERLLLWIAIMLEALNAFLLKKLGPTWWLKTELNQFAPER